LKNLFGDGPLTIIQEVDGKEVEVPVDQLEMTDELLSQIIRGKYEQDKEEATKGKIAVDGVSDFVKQMIEIDKSGGKVSDLLKLNQAYIDPLDQLDLTTVEGQKSAIRLRKLGQGTSEEDIQGFLELYETKGELEAQALRAEQEIRTKVQERIDAEKERATKELKDRQEASKTYKKNIKESIDKTFELNDTAKRNLIKFAAEPDAQNHDALLKAFLDARWDPEKSAKLALFLLDESEFMSQVTTKKVKEHQVGNAIRLGTVRKKGDADGGGFDLNKSNAGDDFMAL
jgi:hypothetical protein